MTWQVCSPGVFGWVVALIRGDQDTFTHYKAII